MSAPRRRSRRSELIGRALLACATLAVSAAAGAAATVAVTRDRAPGVALRINPGDGIALANHLVQEASVSPAVLTRPAEADAARASLRREPLNPKALQFLASAALASQDQDRSVVLAKAAEQVSRRELVVQLMLIEDAVRRGNVSEVLVHYDRALRTRASARRVLFPTLQGALSSADIREALTPYLDEDRVWVSEFLKASAGTRGLSAGVAALLIEGPDTRGRRTLARRFAPDMLAALAADQQYDMLRKYFLATPGAPRELLDSANLTVSAIDQQWGPLAWSALETTGASAVFEQSEQTGSPVARISASPGASGYGLRKLLYLPAGPYRLRVQQDLAEPNDRSLMRWQLTCAAARAPFWESGDATRLVVPSGCPSQVLELFVRGGAEDSGLEALVQQVEIAPDR